MYDADYENHQAMQEYLASTGFITKNSGKRAEHSDGVVRDTEKGKTKYTLMFPEGVPMKDQLIVRIAELYTRGGDTYGDRNWEASSSEDTLKHHTDALWRHFMNFFFDVQDNEDHAAAIVWNVNAVDLTRRNIALKAVDEIVKTAAYEEPQADIMKSYTFPYIGKSTASTGRYEQKEILAGNHADARRLFDSWYDKQPHYNAFPDMPSPAPEIPLADLEWSEGDVLEECTKAGHPNGLTWVYQRSTDTWKYKSREDKELSDASARSLKNLVKGFGPLTCTKGSHTGRVVDGA